MQETNGSIWRIIGGVAGLIAILALFVAATQLLQSKQAADAQDFAQSTQIALLQEQLKVQREMATLQAGTSGSGAASTLIATRLQELESTAIALSTQAARIKDPSLYDNFDNPPYDGTFDSTLWIRKHGCENAAQIDGVMVFNDSCSLTVSKPTSVTIDQLEFEARVKVASDHNGGIVTQEIDFITYDLPGGEWWAICGIIAQSEEVNGLLHVVNVGLNEPAEIYQQKPAEYDQWYIIRFEVDSNTMTFSCYINDQLIGSIMPKDASLLKEAHFERTLEAARDPGAFATTFADDVRIKP